MAVRRSTSSPRSGSSSPSTSSISRDLPPARRSRPLKAVTPPLENTSLKKLIYTLVVITTILTAFYSYRLVQHKKAVGGWWNLALGRRPPQMETPPPTYFQGGRGGNPKHHQIEDRIAELANAFGIPAPDLASAIAVAVRNYVPPASLSPIAAEEIGDYVKVMLKGDNEIEENTGRNGATSIQSQPSPTTDPGVVESVLEGVGSFVGMDEP